MDTFIEECHSDKTAIHLGERQRLFLDHAKTAVLIRFRTLLSKLVARTKRSKQAINDKLIQGGSIQQLSHLYTCCLYFFYCAFRLEPPQSRLYSGSHDPHLHAVRNVPLWCLYKRLCDFVSEPTRVDEQTPKTIANTLNQLTLDLHRLSNVKHSSVNVNRTDTLLQVIQERISIMDS